jgi:hypothetical protein
VQSSLSKVFKTTTENRFYLLYLLVFVLCIIFSIFFGYSYDESSFASVPVYFYYYGINPFYYWKFGLFYLAIILGGYFPAIVLNILGINNVLVEEFGIKLPIVLAVFISGIFVYKILKNLTANNYLPKIGSLLFVFNPLVFFYSVFHGNPMIISLMFLLASLYYLGQKKLKASYFMLAVSGTIYLFPFFFLPYYLLYTYKKYPFKKLVVATTVFVIISLIGVLSTYIVYAILGINNSAGTITGSGYVSIATYAFKPSTWSLYELFFVFYHNSLPYDIFQIIFVVFLLSPLIFLLATRRPLNKLRDMIFCNLIVAFSFALLSPTSDPQYLEALVPFVILLLAYGFNHKDILFFNILGLLNILLVALVTPYNFNQYYIDVYPSLSHFYILWSSSWFLRVTFIYLCFSIVLLFYFFKLYSKKSEKISFYTVYIKTRKMFKVILKGIILFGVISMIVIAPGLTHLPTEFVFQKSYPIDISPSYTENRGNITSYTFQTTEWSLISKSAKENSNVFLRLQGYPKPLSMGMINNNISSIEINNTRWIAESFSLNISSEVLFSFLSSVNSSKDIGLSLFRGNISEEDFLGNLTTMTFTPVNYDVNGLQDRTIYMASVQLNRTLSPGSYSFMIFPASNITFDIFQNIGKMQDNKSYFPSYYLNHKIIVYNQSRGSSYSVLAANIYYLPHGNQSILLNGNAVTLHLFSVNDSLIQYNFPPTNANDYQNLTMDNNVSYSYNFVLIFYMPYPTNSKLILEQYYYFITGAFIFTGIALIGYYYFRKCNSYLKSP